MNNMAREQNSQFEKYKPVLEVLVSEEQVRDVLTTIQKDDFVYFSEDYIQGYFKQFGVEYKSTEDVDNFARFLGAELQEKYGIKAKQVVEGKIARQKLEQSLSCEGWVNEYEQLDNLVEPLNQLFENLYENVEFAPVNSNPEITNIDPVALIGQDFGGKVYFNPKKYVKREILSICLGKGDYTFKVDRNTGKNYGVGIWLQKTQVKSRTGIFKIKKHNQIKKFKKIFVANLSPSSKQSSITFTTSQEFINAIKKELRQNSPRAKEYVTYLKFMFKIPEIMVAYKQQKKTEVEGLLKGLDVNAL